MAKTGLTARNGSRQPKILERGYCWNPKGVPFLKRPLGRVISGSALLTVSAWFISNFFQLRGYVNLTASRIDLAIACLFSLGAAWLFALSLPKYRIQAGVVFSIVLLGTGLFVDRVTRTANGVTSLPQSTTDELDAVDQFIGRRDEYALDQLFGFLEMRDLNILIVRDRIEFFRKTGNPGFDIAHYACYGTYMLYSTETGSFYKKGGSAFLYPNPYEVAGILLPNTYSSSKHLLDQYAQSPKLPTTVIQAINDFDATVQDNANGLIDVLNNAVHKNPDLLLYNSEPNSRYWQVLTEMCAARFKPLKPKADLIVITSRKARGIS